MEKDNPTDDVFPVASSSASSDVAADLGDFSAVFGEFPEIDASAPVSPVPDVHVVPSSEKTDKTTSETVGLFGTNLIPKPEDFHVTFLKQVCKAKKIKCSGLSKADMCKAIEEEEKKKTETTASTTSLVGSLGSSATTMTSHTTSTDSSLDATTKTPAITSINKRKETESGDEYQPSKKHKSSPESYLKQVHQRLIKDGQYPTKEIDHVFEQVLGHCGILSFRDLRQNGQHNFSGYKITQLQQEIIRAAWLLAGGVSNLRITGSVTTNNYKEKTEKAADAEQLIEDSTGTSGFLNTVDGMLDYKISSFVKKVLEPTREHLSAYGLDNYKETLLSGRICDFLIPLPLQPLLAEHNFEIHADNFSDAMAMESPQGRYFANMVVIPEAVAKVPFNALEPQWRRVLDNLFMPPFEELPYACGEDCINIGSSSAYLQTIFARITNQNNMYPDITYGFAQKQEATYQLVASNNTISNREASARVYLKQNKHEEFLQALASYQRALHKADNDIFVIEQRRKIGDLSSGSSSSNNNNNNNTTTTTTTTTTSSSTDSSSVTTTEDDFGSSFGHDFYNTEYNRAYARDQFLNDTSNTTTPLSSSRITPVGPHEKTASTEKKDTPPSAPATESRGEKSGDPGIDPLSQAYVIRNQIKGTTKFVNNHIGHVEFESSKSKTMAQAVNQALLGGIISLDHRRRKNTATYKNIPIAIFGTLGPVAEFWALQYDEADLQHFVATKLYEYNLTSPNGVWMCASTVINLRAYFTDAAIVDRDKIDPEVAVPLDHAIKDKEKDKEDESDKKGKGKEKSPSKGSFDCAADSPIDIMKLASPLYNSDHENLYNWTHQYSNRPASKQIFMGTKKGSHTLLVMKELLFNHNSLREASLLFYLQGPHVVKLLDVFRTATKIVLVMECLISPFVDTFKELFDFLRQLVKAVSWCHSHGIVHHDLAPRNILKDTDGIVRLLDFGQSMPVGMCLIEHKRSEAENFPFDTECSFGYDVFCCASVFIELLMQLVLDRSPTATEKRTVIHCMQGNFDEAPLPEVWKAIPAEYRRILKSMLNIHSWHRPSAVEVGIELEKLIEFDERYDN